MAFSFRFGFNRWFLVFIFMRLFDLFSLSLCASYTASPWLCAWEKRYFQFIYLFDCPTNGKQSHRADWINRRSETWLFGVWAIFAYSRFRPHSSENCLWMQGWPNSPNYHARRTQAFVKIINNFNQRTIPLQFCRYWAVTNVDYIHSRTTGRVFMMIFFVWVTGVIVSLAPQFGWKDPEYLQRIEQQKCMVSQDLGYQVCIAHYMLITTMRAQWIITTCKRMTFVEIGIMGPGIELSMVFHVFRFSSGQRARVTLQIIYGTKSKS